MNAKDADRAIKKMISETPVVTDEEVAELARAVKQTADDEIRENLKIHGSPRRIQRKRTKGWRMPPNTVSVCRPGKWGNPHPVGKPCPMCDGEIHTRQEAVDCYEADVKHACAITIAQARAELRGKNLACFCPLVDAQNNYCPCHADVLLRVANDQNKAREDRAGNGA